MGCEHVPLPGGGHAIACSRGRRRRPCSVCKTRPHTKLCDFPLKGKKAGKTCSAPLCDACSVRQGNDLSGDTIDFCPAHDRVAKAPPAVVIAHGDRPASAETMEAIRDVAEAAMRAANVEVGPIAVSHVARRDVRYRGRGGTFRRKSVQATAETEKALRVSFHDGKARRDVWVPKSHIHDDSEVFAEGDEGDLVVSRWIAEQKDWIAPEERDGLNEDDDPWLDAPPGDY